MFGIMAESKMAESKKAEYKMAEYKMAESKMAESNLIGLHYIGIWLFSVQSAVNGLGLWLTGFQLGYQETFTCRQTYIRLGSESSVSNMIKSKGGILAHARGGPRMLGRVRIRDYEIHEQDQGKTLNKHL